MFRQNSCKGLYAYYIIEGSFLVESQAKILQMRRELDDNLRVNPFTLLAEDENSNWVKKVTIEDLFNELL